MNRRAKTITLGVMALGVTVLVLGGIAVRDPIAEWWYLRQLSAGSPDERKAAAKNLGAMGSVRAIPALLELAAKDLFELAAAERRLPLGSAFLVSAETDGDGFEVVLVWSRGDGTVLGLHTLTSTARGDGFQAILRVLSKRRPEALRALIAGLAHPREGVRYAAALTLAQVEPTEEVERALRDALRTESATWLRRVLESVLERRHPGVEGQLKRNRSPIIREDIDILWPNPAVAPPPTGPAVSPR